jgi:hypothetical protein
MVTFNVIALGGRVSFFQSFSILNYCIFPIYIGVYVNKLLFFFQVQNRIFTFSIMGVSVIWTCLCNLLLIVAVYIFIGVNAPESKKFLSVFPALIYYLYIGILLTFTWNLVDLYILGSFGYIDGYLFKLWIMRSFCEKFQLSWFIF